MFEKLSYIWAKIEHVTFFIPGWFSFLQFVIFRTTICEMRILSNNMVFSWFWLCKNLPQMFPLLTEFLPLCRLGGNYKILMVQVFGCQIVDVTIAFSAAKSKQLLWCQHKSLLTHSTKRDVLLDSNSRINLFWEYRPECDIRIDFDAKEYPNIFASRKQYKKISEYICIKRNDTNMTQIDICIKNYTIIWIFKYLSI